MTVLAVLDPAKGMSILCEAILQSREIESLESAVEAFLLGARRLKVGAACVGVAGPVVDGRCASRSTHGDGMSPAGSLLTPSPRRLYTAACTLKPIRALWS